MQVQLACRYQRRPLAQLYHWQVGGRACLPPKSTQNDYRHFLGQSSMVTRAMDILLN